VGVLDYHTTTALAKGALGLGGEAELHLQLEGGGAAVLPEVALHVAVDHALHVLQYHKSRVGVSPREVRTPSSYTYTYTDTSLLTHTYPHISTLTALASHA